MHWKRVIYKNPELSSARRGNGFSRQVAIRAALSAMSGKMKERRSLSLQKDLSRQLFSCAS